MAKVLLNALAQPEKPQDHEDDHDDADDVDNGVHERPFAWGAGSNGVHNALHDIRTPTIPFLCGPCQGHVIGLFFLSPVFPPVVFFESAPPPLKLWLARQ
jgi:hypothetical protein